MNRTKKSILVYGLVFAVLLSLSLAACGPANSEEPKVDFPPESNNIEDPGASAETGEQVEAEAVKDPPPATATATPEPTPEPQPAESQEISFTTSDGRSMRGRYFPAASEPAPLVVLMHWAPGDQYSWSAIGPWMQNRGLEVMVPDNTSDTPWLDPSWFPPFPEDTSLAVFTFTFQGCEGGCQEFLREEWLQDAYAAVETARNLPGVDPDRVAIIGASIGADGAVNACGEGCLGALSLSPGDYLGLSYPESSYRVMEAGGTVWCLASEDDTASAKACRDTEGNLYHLEIYPGGDHGMRLLKPNTFDPYTMPLIIEFLREVFEF